MNRAKYISSLTLREQLLVMLQIVNEVNREPACSELRPAREGVIIECPLNGQFNDAHDVILTSQNDFRGFAGDDDDDEPTLGTLITRYKSLK